MDYFDSALENLAIRVVENRPIEELDVDGIIIGIYENFHARQKTAFSRIKSNFGNIVDFKGKENEVIVLYNVQGIK
jgi:hypothetical protein